MSSRGLKLVGFVLGELVAVGLPLVVGGIESRTSDGEDEGNTEGKGVELADGGFVCNVGSVVVMFVIFGVGDSDADMGGSEGTVEGAIVRLIVGLAVIGNDNIEG